MEQFMKRGQTEKLWIRFYKFWTAQAQLQMSSEPGTAGTAGTAGLASYYCSESFWLNLLQQGNTQREGLIGEAFNL